MPAATALIICPDMDEYATFWPYALQHRKIQPHLTQTAEDALARLERNPFDLVIVDATPDLAEPATLCRELRALVANPILIVAEERSEIYQTRMYEAGVDEYIVKPIGIRLLLAKITVWLQRAWNLPTETLEGVRAGTFFLEPSRRELVSDVGQSIKLTNLEFRLMHLLINNPDRTMESGTIVNRVWGHFGEGDNALLKHLVYRLRRKLEEDPANPRHLVTIPGEGYAFHT